MKHKRSTFLFILILVVIAAVIAVLVFLVVIPRFKSHSSATEPASIKPTQTSVPQISQRDIETAYTSAINAVSAERMFETLNYLTSIQPHSGWRGSATEGEKEGLDYMQSRLSELEWLVTQGMTQERETFHVFLAAEDHTTSVFLSTADQTMVEIPADGIRGNRDDVILAINMDSDGSLNDNASDPLTREGDVVVVQDVSILEGLSEPDVKGKILLVNYAMIDTGLAIGTEAKTASKQLMALNPAAIILVTRFSNTVGESHGTFIGDGGGVFQIVPYRQPMPVVFFEIENLAPLGIAGWEDMNKLTSARVVWDTDVSNPAESGNLIVHIPGRNPNMPVLISAHIDSPNSPGALDDGSGVALLLEIAAVLNEQQIQPETDLYLTWYGSEELGLYGSQYFTTTHSDLLNRLQANIQIDCLSRPLDGMPAELTLEFSYYNSPTISTDPLGKYLRERAQSLGAELATAYWPFASDNGSLSAFGISNLDLIYESDQMNNTLGGVWYTGHFHDPYDTVTLVKDIEDVYIQMTKLALSAAFIPPDQPGFVNRQNTKKAVFLANHTEAPQMTPAGMPEFSQALISAGYQVSVVPFGSPVTAEQVSGADMVVVLPPYDYPVDGNMADYDTGWTIEEAVVINVYAKTGGRVLVVNSGYRLKLYNRMYDANEDWADLNILTDQWGVHFYQVGGDRDIASRRVENWLTADLSGITLTRENAIPFKISNRDALAGPNNMAYLAEIKTGKGEVVILSDLTALGATYEGLINPQFVENIANWK